MLDRTTYKRNTVCHSRIHSAIGCILSGCDTLQLLRHQSVFFACGSITKLQMELHLVYEERDKLTKELKRTPELIEITLAQLREQCKRPENAQPDGQKSTCSKVWVPLCLCTSFSDESKLRRQQQELEQSWVEVRRAAAGGEQAEHDLRLVQAQLGECRVSLEEVSRDLLHQKEHGERSESLTLTYPGNARFGLFWSHFHLIWEHHRNRK